VTILIAGHVMQNKCKTNSIQCRPRERLRGFVLGWMAGVCAKNSCRRKRELGKKSILIIYVN